VKQDKPAVTLNRPDLVIIDETLWNVLHTRLREARTKYLRDGNGRLLRKPFGPARSSALLSGFGTCVICGGGMSHVTRGSRQYVRPYYYVCCRNHKQGKAGCPNDFRQRAEVVDSIFLEGLQREVLTPAVTRRILELAAERLRREMEAEPSKVEALKKQRTKLKAEIDRLVASIAHGDAPENVIKAIRDREDRQAPGAFSGDRPSRGRSCACRGEFK